MGELTDVEVRRSYAMQKDSGASLREASLSVGEYGGMSEYFAAATFDVFAGYRKLDVVAPTVSGRGRAFRGPYFLGPTP